MKSTTAILAILAVLAVAVSFAPVKVQKRSHRFYALQKVQLTTIDDVPLEGLLITHTTNPYKDWYNGDPLNELTVTETYKRVDVVLALDEEAVDKWGIDYTVRVVERADEALVHHYNIDLKIQEIITYESDDSIEWMNPDVAEYYGYPDAPTLYEEAINMLQNRFDGETEIIIAVTGQEVDPRDDTAGLAPGYPIIRHNTLVMVTFQVYFFDDNLVQHEVAHCFCCDDHPEDVNVWCAMARYKELIYGWVEEDGMYFGPYNSMVWRSILAYDWCEECDEKLRNYDAGHWGGGNPFYPPQPLGEGEIDA